MDVDLTWSKWPASQQETEFTPEGSEEVDVNEGTVLLECGQVNHGEMALIPSPLR